MALARRRYKKLVLQYVSAYRTDILSLDGGNSHVCPALVREIVRLYLANLRSRALELLTDEL